MVRISIIALLCTLFLMIGCQVEEYRKLENHGDILSDAGGMSLDSPERHRSGWGRTDCLMCHYVRNIHLNPGHQGPDLETVLERIRVENSGDYCMSCHDDNGVE